MAQVQWDAFLQDLDDKLRLGANGLHGHPTCVSPETALISATTGRYALIAYLYPKSSKHKLEPRSLTVSHTVQNSDIGETLPKG